jgi:hypothetical protein
MGNLTRTEEPDHERRGVLEARVRDLDPPEEKCREEVQKQGGP